MGDHDNTPTCLSAEPHHPREISDKLIHYFGCIEIAERRKFFDATNVIWRWEWRNEVMKTIKLSRNADLKGRDAEVAIKNLFHEKNPIWKWELGYEKIKELVNEASSVWKWEWRNQEMKTIKLAHKANIEQNKAEAAIEELFNNPTDQATATDRVNKTIEELVVGIEIQNKRTVMLKHAIQEKANHLVECLHASLHTWKADPSLRKRIEKVQKWKSKKQKSGFRSFSGKEKDEKEKDQGKQEGWVRRAEREPEYEDYSLLKDTNAYVIQYRRSGNSDAHSGHERQPIAQHPSTMSNSQGKSEQYFEPVSEESDDWRFKGSFPHQTVALHTLLDQHSKRRCKNEERPSDPTDSILSKSRDAPGDRIRYFHIPSNNMEVSHRQILSSSRRSHKR